MLRRTGAATLSLVLIVTFVSAPNAAADSGDFLTEWTTTSANQDVKLPLVNGGDYDFTINWGDGSPEAEVTSWDDPDATHQYVEQKSYDVTISGTIAGWRFNNAGSRALLTKVYQWGSLQVVNSDNLAATDRGGYFYGTSNMEVPATDQLDIGGVTDMTNMFNNAAKFNQPIGNWNTSSVTRMTGMFRGASSFNQPIGNWKTSNVESMSYMFHSALQFNQPIGTWNTSNVTDVSQMFNGASSFNQPLGNWNISKLSALDSMFASATSFNQPLAKWDVSKITSLVGTFSGASSFNQPLANWDVSKVTTLSGTFRNATSFNQPIGNWNTASLQSLFRVFAGATNFNQPIGNWDTSKVTTMSTAFDGATQFNQDLSNWNISSLNIGTSMLNNSGLSPRNYDALLNGWAAQSANARPGITLGATGLFYSTLGEAGRNTLTSAPLDWTIAGDELGESAAFNGPVAVSGTPKVGKTLTASAQAHGEPAPTVTFRWQRSPTGTGGWSNIAGANSRVYVVNKADANSYLRAVATATNEIGAPAVANSSAVGPVPQTGPTSRPVKPRRVRVSGGPLAKAKKVTWRKGATSGPRAVQHYRIKLNVRGCGTVIANKKLGKSRTSYTFKRSWLLRKRNSTCSRKRGEVTSNRVRYRVRVQAVNSRGVATTAKSFVILRKR